MRAPRKIPPRVWLCFGCRYLPTVLLSALLFGSITIIRQRFFASPVYRADCEIYIGHSWIKYNHDRYPLRRQRLVLVYDELRRSSMMAQDYDAMFRTAAFRKKIIDRFASTRNGRKPKPFNLQVVHRNLSESGKSRHWTVYAISGDPEEAAIIANLAGEVSREEMMVLTGDRAVRILNPAIVPEKPINSSYLRQALKEAAIGGSAALAAALLFFLLDSRIRHVCELQECIPIPLLAVIPQYRLDKNLCRQGLVVNSTAAETKRHRHPDADFQILASTLHYGTAPRPDSGKVYAVTSPMPHEGKTFIAANLAAAFAQMGIKTLIINCNLYGKSGISRFFGKNPPSGGLVNLLNGEKNFDECVKRGVAQCATLDAIFGGPVPPVPASILDSEAFRSLLDYCRCRYDAVILDSAPIAMAADALVVCRAADAVVLSARCGYTRQETLKGVYRQLKDINLAGVVYNGA